MYKDRLKYCQRLPKKVIVYLDILNTYHNTQAGIEVRLVRFFRKGLLHIVFFWNFVLNLKLYFLNIL